MSRNPIDSNPLLEAALNWRYPEYAEEHGIEKVVAFGDHSHKCPIYVRKVPPCTIGCPAGNDIRAWLTLVQQAKLKGRSWQESYELAWHEASKTTPFPASCGRVCPHPCETGCNRGQKDDGAVNIAGFERWLGDYGIRHGFEHKKMVTEAKTKKVAIIGAGPAGLSCAFQLARRGYPVTVFEAAAQPGGMLRYGIPAFRLPRPILDAEIAAIARLGVEIVCNAAIGREREIADLTATYDAIFVGIGAQRGLALAGEGMDAANVLSGVEFLKQVNIGHEVTVGDHVVVIGGGNTAITAARVARRLGAAHVTMLYRRTRAEMPTLDREIDDAIIEGIDIRYLVTPVGMRTENGRAVAVRCQPMQLGEADASGRRRAIPAPGNIFELSCSTVIAAISQRPDWGGLEQFTPEHGWMQPGEDWSVSQGIYAGGDVIQLALVATAIGHGRKAAERISSQLSGEPFPPNTEGPTATPETLRLEYYAKLNRNENVWMPAKERCSNGLELEADLGLGEEQIQAESKRCMSCGLCFECYQCLIFCPQSAIQAFPDRPIGEVMYTSYSKCVGCHICSLACPCGYIQMGMGKGL